MLRKPQAWTNPVTASTPTKIAASRSGLNLTAESLSSLQCPSTGKPMKVVCLRMANAKGETAEPTWVAVNEHSRVVLPLPNEMMEAIRAGQFNPEQHNQTVKDQEQEAESRRHVWDRHANPFA